MNNQSPVDVLERARILLVKRGWIKWSMQGAGGFCLIGALNQACIDLDRMTELGATAKHLNATIAWRFRMDAIQQFNDHPKTTLDDVLEAIDLTLANLVKNG